MYLRTNKLLKFFAILVFSLELLAPAIFYTESAYSKLTKFFSFQKTLTHVNLALSVFTEECDTEERDDIDGRGIILFTGHSLLDTRLKFAEAARVNSFFLCQDEYFRSSPSLFELHCMYVI